MVLAATTSLRAPVAARPLAARPRPARRLTPAAPRASLSDVGKYLSEAASQIFRPQENDTPWKGSGTPFTGAIVHHEEASRLKQLVEQVEAVRKDMEASGQVAASAAGEGAEATTYKVDAKGDLVEEGSLQEYMTTAISRLFGHNFKGDENEPKEWASVGYKSSWRHGSRRDIQRQYDSLVRFQKVVKKTLEQVEADAAKKA